MSGNLASFKGFYARELENEATGIVRLAWSSFVFLCVTMKTQVLRCACLGLYLPNC